MSLKDTINNDVKTAMKAHDAARVSTLRMVVSEIKKREIDSRKPLEEAEVIRLLGTMIKQRHDSIDAFTKGNRPDLVDKEKAEVALLTAYLPEQLDRAEVEKAVAEAIQESGATGPSDIGKVMKAALVKTGGRADGKLVNEIARAKLSPKP